MNDERDVLGVEAENIAALITSLKNVLLGAVSWDWEREYRCQDLTEKVQRLEEQVKDIMPVVPYADWPEPPLPPPRAVLDTTREEEMEALAKEIGDLRREKETREAQIAALKSRNWELEYTCSDLGEEVGRLKTQLRSSVSWGVDAEASSTAPKTALEQALEERVRELEGVVRNLTWTAEHRPSHAETAAGR